MTAAIELHDVSVGYGKVEAMHEVSLTVEPGRCHALFGRNGAGKTTTLKTLLGFKRPTRGTVRVLGLDPWLAEAEVKGRVAYVPDTVGFYPWMTVRDVLALQASLRPGWSYDVEHQLLSKFELDEHAPTTSLSKGQKTQLALTMAVAADPEVLILDEPTSGLDPLVRRQFLEAVIGAFQDRRPDQKTLLVSTHLIREFEGVVDEFTVMAAGRVALTMNADAARARFGRVRAWFEHEVPTSLPVKQLAPARHDGRSLEVLVDGALDEAKQALARVGATRIEAEALSLEDIFLATSHAVLT